MRAVVMAGGEGTRLQPLTVERPKPLLRVGNVPVLLHVISLLDSCGIDDVVITVRYLWRQIVEEIGERYGGVRIRYQREDFPLGTAGSVRGAVGTDAPVMVVSGDALTDIDLGRLMKSHRACGARVSIALGRVSDPTRFGVVVTDSDGRVTEFVEKPPPGQAKTDLINTGIYVVEPEVLALIPEGECYDFARHLFPELLERGVPIHGHEIPGYWCDIGDPDQYLTANIDACSGRIRLKAVEGIGAVEIAPGARVTPDTVLGAGVRVERGAVVGPCTTIGPGSVIGTGARVAWSTIGVGAVVGAGADVTRAAIGDGSRIGPDTVIGESAVIGDRVAVGEGVVVRPGIRIWPQKQVRAGETVSRDIVWGHGLRPMIPSRGVVQGLIGLELGPETTAEVAVAVARGLGSEQSIVIGSASGPVAVAMRLAAVAGAVAGGARAVDCGSVSRPALALTQRALGAAAGLYITTRGIGDRRLRIEILGADGLESDQADMWVKAAVVDRVTPAVPGDYRLPEAFGESAELHCRRLLTTVNADRIRKRRWRGIVSYERDVSGPTLTSLCDNLGLHAIGGVSIMSRDHAWRALGRYGAESGAEFAALVTGDGTGLILATEGETRGRDELIVLLASLLLRRGLPDNTLHLPPDASRHCDQLAKNAGVHPCRVSWPPPGRPEARLWADGTAQLLLILDSAAEMEVRVAELGAPRPTFSRQAVPCPWDMRARVLRELAERNTDGTLPSVAGGLHYADDRGWAYVVPDRASARLLIACEAATPEMAAELSGDLRRAIDRCVKRGED